VRKLSWTEIVRTIFEIVSGLAALIFIYQYFQSAEQPDRQRVFLLLGLVAVAVLLAFIGRRLVNWALSTAKTAVRFIRQNALLVGSLLLAAGLICFLLQRTQDIVLAGAAAGLVLTTIGIAVGVVRLLAITRPQFVGLPVRVEEAWETPAVPKGLWSYDFIEHFNDATTRKSAEQAHHIQVMQKAQSLGIARPAIFEHPRAYGQTVLTYVVEGIPEGIQEVKLEFLTGILDVLPEETSQFHKVPDNRIEFEIWVNEGRVFREVRDQVGWSEFKHVPGLRPSSGALEVSFRTDAKGNPHWNWAAWGEPKLVGVKPTSSAAG